MPSVVVAERRRRVDVLWGSSRSPSERRSSAAISAPPQRPALEITPEAVAFSHRGQPNSTRLVGPGELYVHTSYLGAKNRLVFLKVRGSDGAIPLEMFDLGEVKGRLSRERLAVRRRRRSVRGSAARS